MKDEIIRLAKKAGIAKHGLGWTCWDGQLEHFYDLAVQHEREECAKVCEDLLMWNEDDLGSSAAKAIRARGQNANC